ncbi:hypothetical protein F4808DRAFT_438091 [Astrocystis sublimbata]|nr:hypothetical protein F4808DRAFT_438091 [Astrocystis sublimbata]
MWSNILFVPPMLCQRLAVGQLSARALQGLSKYWTVDSKEIVEYCCETYMRRATADCFNCHHALFNDSQMAEKGGYETTSEPINQKVGCGILSQSPTCTPMVQRYARETCWQNSWQA